ncbi:MAG TPA: adenosylcobalamin-dependent ribonucleoside-diphosphate reductase, partial [Longimicrobiales bacterium]|nr:adenosylcobalamin-dependent ribonucleoside-diphosphate reductase [Longimicrobiales bacterium]
GQEDANEIFDLIIEGAWATGEPGVFFIDQANRYNPVPKLGSYEATNPCGEQPLLAYDVCNLGSVNVGAFARLDVPDGTPVEARIDWEGLRQTVHLATHFLDNVIDANQYPLPEIDALAKQIRRIGLGIMGWADLLVRVGVPYNSDEGIELARRVMAFVDDEGKNASEKLAETRGTFAAWKESIWGPDKTCARDAAGNRVRPMRKLRNCNVTTVAPTGTISIIADCSGGIEPLFAVAFMRNQAGVRMPDVNQDFVHMAEEDGWYSEALMERIAEEGHIHFDEVPDEAQRIFVTAHDVTPEWHIRMQAAFQEHVDSAISKTCNFPRESTQDHVREIYLKAHELRCKGVTVYRDGSRPAQVLSTGRTEKKEGSGNENLDSELADAREKNHQYQQQIEMLKHELQELEARHQRRLHKRNRPAALHGVTRRIQSPLGDLYVTINEDEDARPFELFATLGKAGGAAMADAEAIGRLVSLALRSGISLAEVHQQLRGISCDRAVGFGANKVLSIPDAIAQVIAMYDMEKAGVQQELPMGGAPAAAPASTPAPAPRRPLGPPNASPPNASQPNASQPKKLDVGVYDPGDTFLGSCPECSSELSYQEGCVKCHACGYSECG